MTHPFRLRDSTLLCNHCQKEKTHSEFYLNRKTGLPARPECRDCFRKKAQKRHRAHVKKGEVRLSVWVPAHISDAFKAFAKKKKRPVGVLLAQAMLMLMHKEVQKEIRIKTNKWRQSA